jgi:hypothetical protein
MESNAMPAKNKKKRPPARLDLIWRTLTQIVDGAHAARGTTETPDARINPYTGVGPHRGRHFISVEFNVAIGDKKRTGSKSRTGIPAAIVAATSEGEFNAAATSIKFTVSYEPWCTVNVIV